MAQVKFIQLGTFAKPYIYYKEGADNYNSTNSYLPKVKKALEDYPGAILFGTYIKSETSTKRYYDLYANGQLYSLGSGGTTGGGGGSVYLGSEPVKAGYVENWESISEDLPEHGSVYIYSPNDKDLTTPSTTGAEWRTAYYFEADDPEDSSKGGLWKAFTGNVNAENVWFPDGLWRSAQWGVADAVAEEVNECVGFNLAQVLDNYLLEEKNYGKFQNYTAQIEDTWKINDESLSSIPEITLQVNGKDVSGSRIAYMPGTTVTMSVTDAEIRSSVTDSKYPIEDNTAVYPAQSAGAKYHTLRYGYSKVLSATNDDGETIYVKDPDFTLSDSDKTDLTYEELINYVNPGKLLSSGKYDVAHNLTYTKSNGSNTSASAKFGSESMSVSRNEDTYSFTSKDFTMPDANLVKKESPFVDSKTASVVINNKDMWTRTENGKEFSITFPAVPSGILQTGTTSNDFLYKELSNKSNPAGNFLTFAKKDISDAAPTKTADFTHQATNKIVYTSLPLITSGTWINPDEYEYYNYNNANVLSEDTTSSENYKQNIIILNYSNPSTKAYVAGKSPFYILIPSGLKPTNLPGAEITGVYEYTAQNTDPDKGKLDSITSLYTIYKLNAGKYEFGFIVGSEVQNNASWTYGDLSAGTNCTAAYLNTNRDSVKITMTNTEFDLNSIKYNGSDVIPGWYLYDGSNPVTEDNIIVGKEYTIKKFTQDTRKSDNSLSIAQCEITLPADSITLPHKEYGYYFDTVGNNTLRRENIVAALPTGTATNVIITPAITSGTQSLVLSGSATANGVKSSTSLEIDETSFTPAPKNGTNALNNNTGKIQFTITASDTASKTWSLSTSSRNRISHNTLYYYLYNTSTDPISLTKPDNAISLNTTSKTIANKTYKSKLYTAIYPIITNGMIKVGDIDLMTIGSGETNETALSLQGAHNGDFVFTDGDNKTITYLDQSEIWVAAPLLETDSTELFIKIPSFLVNSTEGLTIKSYNGGLGKFNDSSVFGSSAIKNPETETINSITYNVYKTTSSTLNAGAQLYRLIF